MNRPTLKSCYPTSAAKPVRHLSGVTTWCQLRVYLVHGRWCPTMVKFDYIFFCFRLSWAQTLSKKNALISKNVLPYAIFITSSRRVLYSEMRSPGLDGKASADDDFHFQGVYVVRPSYLERACRLTACLGAGIGETNSMFRIISWHENYAQKSSANCCQKSASPTAICQFLGRRQRV